MPADDLATELLSTVFDADPLSASMYGFPGYDDRLPDLSDEAEARVAATLTTIAQRAEVHPDQGLTETEHQTLDFVRVLARGMAEAARVPLTEFTICDTFVSPVPGVSRRCPSSRSTLRSAGTATSLASAASPRCSLSPASATNRVPVPGGPRWHGWSNQRLRNSTF